MLNQNNNPETFFYKLEVKTEDRGQFVGRFCVSATSMQEAQDKTFEFCQKAGFTNLYVDKIWLEDGDIK